MNFILADTDIRAFYPLTLTRPVSALRAGMLTIREKWEKRVKGNFSYFTEEHLSGKFPLEISNDNILIDSAVVPDQRFAERISNMPHNQAWVKDNRCLAIRIDGNTLKKLRFPLELGSLVNAATQVLTYREDLLILDRVTDLFTRLDQLIRDDYSFLTKGQKSAGVDNSNQVKGKQLFVKKDARVSCSFINTETGPVFIDKGAEIMEGCMIRGPFYLGKGAVLKMGAKVYGPTSLGPETRVGGEVSNILVQGYSNKGHDGFLGNSVLGEWCNLGADTNSSNLKNNYGQVKIWDYKTSSYTGSGLQFCGLIMGDHSKCAINTQFNTGTTVGVMANIFKSSFPEKYIPSFSWIGDARTDRFDFEKSVELAREVMKRRHVELSAEDIAILRYLSENT